MMATRKRRQRTKKALICTTCNKIFPEIGKLIDHKRIHEELATHTLAVHDLFERPYACNECGKTFSGRRTLLKHSRLHSGVLPFSCSICNKTFYQISKWIDHSRVHTGGNVFPCSLCSQSFTNRNQFVIHLETHDLNPFHHRMKTEGRILSQTGDIFSLFKDSNGCEKDPAICKMSIFSNQKNLDSDLNVHNDISQVQVSNNATSSNKTDFITHYSLYTYGAGFNAFTCSKEELANIALDKRLLRRDPFVCDFCLGTFTRKESLKKHIIRVHASNTGTRNTFCELCFKFFPKKDIMALVDLDKNTYSVPYSAYGSRNHDEQNSVLLVLSCSSCMFVCDKVCSLCGKTVRLCDLRTHLKLHTGELVPCEKCGKTFSDNDSLSNHRESCQAYCPLCEKSFEDVITLNDHRKETHKRDEDLFRIPSQ